MTPAFLWWCMLLAPVCVWAQGLQLGSLPAEPILTIHLTVPDKNYAAITHMMPSGTDIPVVDGRIGPQPVQVEVLRTRGKTSAGFRRKSYLVQLQEPFTFTSQGMTCKLQNFFLLNLALDPHYVHNYFALSCFEQLGLYRLFKKYVEVKINGHTEGVYLLTQRPVDYALQDRQAAVVIRRLNSSTIDSEKTAAQVDPAFVKLCEKTFKDIVVVCRKLEGQALFAALDSVLALDEYFDWLAWNYWVRNGDYTDEVYYYTPLEPRRFRLIPWDFDDIFATAPHEGQTRREQQLGEQMIFSSEDILDRAIAKDTLLYSRYLQRLKALLQSLADPVRLAKLLEKQYAALIPFCAQADVITMSAHDRHPTTQAEMEDHLKNMYTHLLRRAESLLKRLP